MFDGSIRGQSDLILVFVNMLARCNQDGYDDRIPKVMADETGLSLEVVEKTLKCLETPDKYSRTPDKGGRRIELIDPENRNWGWKIINYEKYRNITSNADRRETYRKSKKKSREKAKLARSVHKNVEVSTPVNSCLKMSTQGEGEGEVKGEVEAKAEVKQTLGDKPPLSEPPKLPKQPKEVKPTKKPRARNLVMDALGALEGDIYQIPNSTWKKIGKALKTIREVAPDVTPEEINKRAENYQSHFKDAMLTSTALASHWARCEKPHESKKTLHPNAQRGIERFCSEDEGEVIL